MNMLAVAAFVSIVTCACDDVESSTFTSSSSEHYFRIDSAGDVAEWLEIEHDVRCEGEKALLHLKGVVSKARVFPAEHGFLDFDELEREAAERETEIELESVSETDVEVDAESQVDEVDPRDSLERRFLELAPTFQVVEARLVLDEDGRVTLWRRGRIRRASEWLGTLESEFLHDLLETDESASSSEEQDPPEEPALPEEPHSPFTDYRWDAESLRLLREQIRTGERLWRLEGHAFVVESAMSEENAKLCITNLVREDIEASFRDGRIRLRYLPGDGGWIRSTVLTESEPPKADEDAEIPPPEDPEPAPDDDDSQDPAKFAAELTAAGIGLGSVQTYRELRKAAGLR
jgi:hypothetical protein